MTTFGNLMVIVIIRLDPRLHIPMYFFLVNLSFIEMLYTTTIIPNSLKNFLYEDKHISYEGCFTQMFFFIGSGSSECALLSAMAYDRYIAICLPLVYSNYMNHSSCVKLVLVSWTIGFLNSLVHTVYTATLPFCKDNRISHFFCDIPPLLTLSCKDTRPNKLVSVLVGGTLIVGSLIFICISYFCIVRAILKISRSNARYKTFSTCVCHLTVVVIFFALGTKTFRRQ
ncbi:olfactory receptor 6N2-like [Spea bombifrons]|uniref:olfactory receptor 6N2-like n=1 Tax=Spea bombifrons TaxID=233779 RepID=UPI00234A8878|nr:olfactory receptor 6N2-like [Spea bombifrons]